MRSVLCSQKRTAYRSDGNIRGMLSEKMYKPTVNRTACVKSNRTVGSIASTAKDTKDY